MAKKLIFLFVFLFSTVFSAQTSIDSLAILSHTKNKNKVWVDEMLVKVENIIKSESKLAFEYSNLIVAVSNELDYTRGIENSILQNSQILNVLGNYEEAKKQLQSVLKKNIKNNSYKIKALITLGIVNFNLGLYDEAIEAYDKAEKIIGNNLTSNQYADLCNNRADIYSLRGNYTLAIEDYLLAEKIYKLTNQNSSLAVVYNNLGTENRNLQLYNKSIEYYKQAIEINDAANDFQNLAKNYSNMGVSYEAIDSFATAVEYYKKSLAISERIESNIGIAQNNVNLGSIYFKNNDYKTALAFFNNSLEICKKDKITYGLVLNYMNIGNTNIHIKNYETAIVNLDSALVYAKKMGLPKEESQVYERLMTVYKDKGDFKNAFNFQSLFNEINDSLVTTEKHKQIVELQTKYETVKNQKTIAQLSEKQIKQELTIGYLLVLALLLALLTGWFFYRRKRSLQENKIAEITAENMKLEIQIKNNELVQKSLNISHLQENNKHIASDIEALLKTSKISNNNLNQLLKKIKSSSKNTSIWDEFDLRFKEIHGEFYSKIIAVYPNLYPVELRVVALLRLNLTTKEIAEIMQRSVKTIENNRGIIRKKMNLDRDTNLTSFILAIK